MSVQVENLEKNMVKLTIEVSAEEVEKALETAFQKQKKHFNIPGFRKGKVTRNVVEKMYGVEVFYEEAANTLMQNSYPAAVEESGVDVVSRPTVDVVQIEKGKAFIYTAEVAVKPEVKLGEYKGVTVTKANTKVTAAEVKETSGKATGWTVTATPAANTDDTTDASFTIKYNNADYTNARNSATAYIEYAVRINQQTVELSAKSVDEAATVPDAK